MIPDLPTHPPATVASPRATLRGLLPRPLSRARVVTIAALTLGLSACSPWHLGMMGMMGMMGMGTMERMGQPPVEQSQTCQSLATGVQVDAQQWSRLAADSVRVLLPSHRSKVERMLARCATDSTGRAHDATHAERMAVEREIRADLERMKDMNADSLRAFALEHAARLGHFAELSAVVPAGAGPQRHDSQPRPDHSRVLSRTE